MYLHLSENTETAIVRCLAERPSLTAKEVCERLAQGRHRASRSSVYEKLKNLQERGVLVKMNRGFTVDLSWASEQLLFITDLQSRYREHATSSGVFVTPGDKRTWRFRSFRSLCEFWQHLTLALRTASDDRCFLDWSPYLLFDLACGYAGSKGHRMQAALKRLGGHGFRIYDGASPLNRLLIEQSRDLSFTAASAESSYHRQQGTIINVLDDYVITVRLDERAVRTLDELFSLPEFPDGAVIRRTLDRPVNVRLRLVHDHQKARGHRRKFAAYFGVRL